MFLENYKRFIKYYGQGRYLKLCIFSILSIIAGFLELIGIAMIYPFIMLIINPDLITKHIPFLNIENTLLTGLIIGATVLLIFVLKNLYMIFVQYIQNKFVGDWKKDITAKFMEYYLYAPYKETMKISQSEKIYNLQTVCSIVIDSFVMRGLNFVTNIIIITMIILLLFIKFPLPATITLFFVTVTMYLQNKYFKQTTQQLAATMDYINKKYTTTLVENIMNIKELKILSAEKNFYDNFLKNQQSFQNINILQNFYNSIPPYIIETLIVLALLALAGIISFQNKSYNTSLIAYFAIIVAALFRIAPALNRIQSSIININATRDYVKKINKLFETCNLSTFTPQNHAGNSRFKFEQSIKFENVCFSYNDTKPVLKNITLEINKGDFIGIIGLSGAGKSTLADVLTGLLPVDSGKITIDNQEITQSNFSKFRHMLGYVPQEINILNRSIRENIAWGINEIHDEQVIACLQAARIYDVIKELPDGIYTTIGMGNNNLSQGQKQRLAIARALYRNPEIIILDEATSSLDVQVENEITEMLKNISSTKTIIAIAHRLSTLKACNKLIYMVKGQIVDIGSFEELSQRYPDFANLVKLSSIK